jgi:2-hydroxy-3-keto-5-methylthiopentenyl-1-phosphate phosphatase
MFETIQENKKEITRVFQKMLSMKPETKEVEYLLHKDPFLQFVSSVLEQQQLNRPPIEVIVPQYIEEDKRLLMTMRSKKTSMKELFGRIDKSQDK